ncbi:hypothetical protein ACHAWC_008197 [Mediolabrus comicus]
MHAEYVAPPYLSASFSTTISPVYDSLSLFDAAKKVAFSKSSEKFLQKVFDGHAANIDIVSVGVFDEHITKLSSSSDIEVKRSPSLDHALTFSTVVVAQYQEDDEKKPHKPLMSPDHFHQNVMYATKDFQDHYLTLLKQSSEDVYFSGVDTVIFDKYQANGRPNVSTTESGDSSSSSNIMDVSDETLNAASIAVIVIGCVLSAIFLFASFKLHQKRKELMRNRWRVEERNLRDIIGNKSLEVSQTNNDDFSFDPLVTYNKRNNNFFTDVTTLSSNQSSTAVSSPLFEPHASNNSYTEELHRLPRDQIYAPPGKLGVALDIFNGQPVIQKIRKGSPITGMLQVGDIILAIDDVDTSCMSLAEVTFLMVKNMERVRRITFVRRSK